MRLAGAVAQQWYRKLSPNIMYGVLDVNNYMPKIGGTEYYKPSKEKDFQFFPDEHGLPVVNPQSIRKVVDPSFAIKATIGSKIPNTQFMRTQHIGQWLSRDVNSEPGDLEEALRVGRATGWEIFGEPEFKPFGEGLADNSPIKSNINEYGYLSGSRKLDSKGNNIGGSYVGSYKEFLALFGLDEDDPKTNFTGKSREVKSPRAGIGRAIAGRSGLWLRTSGWPGNWGYIQPQKLSDGRDHDPIGVYYSMIDGENNIVAYNVPTSGWIRTGWKLTNGGDPVYLYPSTDTAVRIDPVTQEVKTTGNPAPSGGMHLVGNRAAERPDPDGDQRRHYHGIPSTWAHRLGNGEHNPNLTIDEKRALIVHTHHEGFDKAHNTIGADKGNRVQKVKAGLWTLGKDVPSLAPGGGLKPGTKTIDWSKVGEIEAFTLDGKEMKRWSKGVYDKPGGRLIGPLKARTAPFRNPEFPYGTGWYRRKDGKVWGSNQHIKDWKNYVPIGELLMHFPNYGNANSVNDGNHSNSDISVVDNDTEGNPLILNGGGLNPGFVDFICRYVLAPLPRNRRFAASNVSGNNGFPQSAWKGSNGKDKHRMKDLTFGMLFCPKDGDEKKSTSESVSDALQGIIDFGVKTIVNAADIPIRREVVDNLFSRNNTKMSLAQCFQELLHPSSIAINTANIQVGARQTGAGTFEIFQASKDWRARARKNDEEELRAMFENRYPLNFFLIDYKNRDSLVQNIDMNSQFDPAISLTFQRGAEAFAGNPDTIVKFLSYGSIAADLKDFLADEDRISNPNNHLYDGIITVSSGASNKAAEIQIKRGAFFDVGEEKKLVSDSLMARFLSQQPERMQKLNAMIQAEPGNNFATQLLAYYMRKCVVTIHGTTGLTPFNTIHIRGILPNLEGEYWVTGVRESITPQDFKTIIEGILIQPKDTRQKSETE